MSPDPRRRAYRARVPRTSIRAAAAEDATQISELLFGEPFTAYEIADGWARGRSELDGYQGYVRSADLGPPGPEPDHVVAAVSAHVYPEPDLKRPPGTWLPLGARLALADDRRDGYCQVLGGGWVPAAHIAPLDRPEPDILATAVRFLGAPYLWGGRTVLGLDCSGLVQIAVQRAGLKCPRDTDRMEREVGDPLPLDTDLASLGPGDLAFTAGHVVFCAGGGRLLHANAHDMAVATEPLDAFLARVPDGLTALRRVATG